MELRPPEYGRTELPYIDDALCKLASVDTRLLQDGSPNELLKLTFDRNFTLNTCLRD